MTFFEALILSVVEGLTEYIPVSSTGHLVLISKFLQINETPFAKCFDILIQFASILAVVVLFWKSFFPVRVPFYKKLIVATIPAGIAGFLLKKKVDEWLGSPHLVAGALLIGGVFLLFLDAWEKKQTRTAKQNFSLKASSALPIADENAHGGRVTLRQSLWMGVWQCLAIIPGTSRSASTIGSGILLGLDRKTAAEFSFLMAVPVMFGASAIKLKVLLETPLATHDWLVLAFACVVTFVISLFVLKLFLQFLRKKGFALFGWYRICVAALIFLFV